MTSWHHRREPGERRVRAVPALGSQNEPWRVKVERLNDFPAVMGRYRVYLAKGMLRHGAGDGWGWTAYTLKGAYRKGGRKLRDLEAREARKQDRRARARTSVYDDNR